MSKPQHTMSLALAIKTITETFSAHDKELRVTDFHLKVITPAGNFLTLKWDGKEITEAEAETIKQKES